jgi:hypothetical protein
MTLRSHTRGKSFSPSSSVADAIINLMIRMCWASVAGLQSKRFTSSTNFRIAAFLKLSSGVKGPAFCPFAGPNFCKGQL